jgi:hypothetical protein
MTAETEYYYRHHDKATGERERRRDDHLRREVHIFRDPQVKQESNDVTQAAFQSPTVHLADLCYQRLIFGRHQVNSLFRREEEGTERPTVQRAHLGRTRFPEYSVQQMFEAGIFLQQDMAVAPTGKEYQGMGNQKNFDPYANGIMVHAGCYLVINGKEGHSIHASFFGGAEKYLQRGDIVRGFNNMQGEATARVRAARMVAALPEATTPTLTPQQGFLNVYGNMVDAEQALEIMAQEYMESKYTTGGDRMEAIVTPYWSSDGNRFTTT